MNYHTQQVHQATVLRNEVVNAWAQTALVTCKKASTDEAIIGKTHYIDPHDDTINPIRTSHVDNIDNTLERFEDIVNDMMTVSLQVFEQVSNLNHEDSTVLFPRDSRRSMAPDDAAT